MQQLIHLLVPSFMAILFLQSGLDKAFNYKGNQAYLTDFFKNSILANTVGILMPLITILELATGITCAIGVIGLALNMDNMETVVFAGLFLAAKTILCLFLGQRIAKDYAGAANMVGYFLVALLGLYIFVR
jgi:hypothetical protein